jgi:hypothetical protein
MHASQVYCLVMTDEVTEVSVIKLLLSAKRGFWSFWSEKRETRLTQQKITQLQLFNNPFITNYSVGGMAIRLQTGRYGVRMPTGEGDSYLLQNVQIDSLAQPDSCSILSLVPSARGMLTVRLLLSGSEWVELYCCTAYTPSLRGQGHHYLFYNIPVNVRIYKTFP